MNFEVILTKIAETHIEEACDYYDSTYNTQLTLNFLSDLEQTIAVLENNPYFQIWTDNYRAIPLSKFPYLVFFEIDETQYMVKVIAAFHTSLNPTKYPK
jgi:toxin ParE1/3/4